MKPTKLVNVHLNSVKLVKINSLNLDQVLLNVEE